MNRKKVLITGFDPFGGDEVNPALEAVKKLSGLVVNDVEMITLEAPTVFKESIEVVKNAILQVQPDVVLCVGQAGGRSHITPERIAINIDDARIPDNKGNQPIDEPIVADGPAAYWTTLPIKKITHELRKAGIPAAVSNSAGTFVCNHLFYGVMDVLSKHTSGIRGGFIHIPYIPEQTLRNGAPSLALDTIVRGLTIAAVTAANETEDLREVGGAIH